MHYHKQNLEIQIRISHIKDKARLYPDMPMHKQKFNLSAQNGRLEKIKYFWYFEFLNRKTQIKYLHYIFL